MKNKEVRSPLDAWIVSGIISFVLLIILGIVACIATSCSPKIIEKVVTQIEYRDREIHDTTEVKIPYEVEKIVTRDTVSHLENTYAKSDAVVSEGFLSHSLESKPQIIKVPVEVHVTDTIIKESEIITEIKEVEKKLSWWQKLRMKSSLFFFIATLGCLVWIFRKQIIKLIK